LYPSYSSGAGPADAKDPGGTGKAEECETGNLAGWEAERTRICSVSGKECKISKGTHTYRHVHVWGKGKLHFEDKGEEIHFWANAILIETDGSLVAGERASASATRAAS
jgi:hypothetical protein